VASFPYFNEIGSYTFMSVNRRNNEARAPSIESLLSFSVPKLAIFDGIAHFFRTYFGQKRSFK